LAVASLNWLITVGRLIWRRATAVRALEQA
jgi:hypothetical protein